MHAQFFEFTGKDGDLAMVYITEGREPDLGILLGLVSGCLHTWRVAVGTQVLKIHQDALEVCK